MKKINEWHFSKSCGVTFKTVNLSSVDIFDIHDLKTRSQNKRCAHLFARASTLYNNIQWHRSHRHFDEEVRNLLISLFQITLLFTTCLCVVASAPGENENRNLSLIDSAIAILLLLWPHNFFFFHFQLFLLWFSCCSHLIRDRMWLHSNDLLQMLYVHFDKFLRFKFTHAISCGVATRKTKKNNR